MSVENLSLQNLSLNPSTSSTPSITLTKESTRSRKPRNRQYVPSDDEDEDDVDESDEASDDEGDLFTSTTKTPSVKPPVPSPSTSSGKQHKKVTPLPSDDEDEDDDLGDDSEDEETLGASTGIYRLQGVQSTSQLGNYTQTMDRQTQRHSAGDSTHALQPPQQPMMGNDMMLTEGSQLLQWQYMQQYHQAQMAHFQQQQQQPHTLKKSHSSTHLRQSGMDLLAQLEHDKAEAKRQKPKLNPSNAKIEGLLAHVPEPGSHNISFQQHQRGQRQQRASMMNQRRPVSHIMMNPQQPMMNQPMMNPQQSMMYPMYPYYAPYPQQQFQPIPQRSPSPMDMSRR